MQTGRERLRQWIDRSRLNQLEAAGVIGIDPGQLSHILTGRRRPGLDMAVKIERATGIPEKAWSHFGEDTPPAEPPPAVVTSTIDRP